jgi:hypothetical protein
VPTPIPMRLSLPSQRLVPVVLLGVLAVVLLAIVAGKVGGGSGDEGEEKAADPQRLMERAFSAQNFKSGKFGATAQVTYDDAPSPALSSLAIKIDGAFDNDPPPPKSDVDLKFSFGGKTSDFGAVSTGKAVYLTLGERAYRLPAGALKQTKSQPEDLTALSALGINPQRWIVNPQSAGTATVGGVETDHVTAQVNVGRFVEDLAQLAARSGNAPGGSREDLKQAEDAIKGATVDFYTAKSDGSLRRLSAQARVDAPNQNGELKLGGRGTIAFDMQFTDVNKPQKVSAPGNLRPASEFESAFNSQIVRAFSGAASSGGGAAQSDSGTGNGGTEAPAPTLPGSAQKYLDCVEKARTDADVQKCAPLLN